jgi:hypothetical protein
MWLVLSSLLPAPAKAPKVISAVRLDLEGRTGLCPGEAAKLDVFTTVNGKESKVRGGEWRDLALEWSLGAVGTKGELAMPARPEAAWGNPGRLLVTAAPGVTDERFLPMRYDCALRIDLSGDAGRPGADGSGGSEESDADGGNGQSGGDGQDGSDAHDVEVRAMLVQEPVRGLEVLQVAVRDLTTGQTHTAAIAVPGGTLVVAANGGPGGDGGRGGDGGDGAAGRDGGDGAQGGDGADGGDGGAITVVVDPAANGKTLGLSVENGGGGGGAAGAGGAAGDGGSAPEGGSEGADGTAGADGHAGTSGRPGPPPAISFGPVGPLW